MAIRASLLIVAALLPLAACDWSQKKPETLTLRAGSAVMSAAPNAQRSSPVQPGIGVPMPGETQSGASRAIEGAGERSLRLYGPGVSRKRQTRI